MALLLGVVGLYGVIAYSVSQRTREIGVRMALGAEHGSVYRLILKEAGWLVAVGIGLGAVGSVAAATLRPETIVRRKRVGCPDHSCRCRGARDRGGSGELRAGASGRVCEPGGGSADGVAARFRMPAVSSVQQMPHLTIPKV